MARIVNGSIVVKRCGCVSNYQDRRYGLQKRVFNVGGKNKDIVIYKCSVCGQTQF